MRESLTPETVSLLLAGLTLTIALTVVTSITSFVVGIGVGTLRLSANRLIRSAAGTFVEVFRNIPALIQIIFWAFAFPSLFPADTRMFLFFDNSVMTWLTTVTGLSLPYSALAACFGLTLNTGAHMAELFRAGVGTLPRERIETARLLGAGTLALFWWVLLPGGVRAAFPAITTRLIHNMKNTALASFVAVPEFFQTVQASITQSFRAVEFLTIAAVVYLLLSTVMAGLLRRVDIRLNRGRMHVRPD